MIELAAIAGVAGAAISLLRDANTVHDGYKKASGIMHGTDTEKLMNCMEQMRNDNAQHNTQIADSLKHFERLSEHILYAPNLGAIKDNNVSRQRQVDDLRQIRESLDPLQKALGGDLLSSAVIWTPEKMQQAFDQDPWKVLIDVRPVARASKPNNPDMVPFIFEDAGTQYIGWQIKGVLPMMFGCEYNEIWTPLSSNSGSGAGGYGGRSNKQNWSGQTGQDQYGQYSDLELQQVKQRFRLIPAGRFIMGSPKSEPQRYSDETQHRVSIQHPFWMADTACTQALWQAVMGNNPASFTDHSENPVEQVSWDDIQVFLQRANELIPDMILRLPSEAEWEYACRAGTNTPFSFGNSITPNQANYNGEYVYDGGSKGEYREETVVVKSFTANQWGLYQMHGNVWEWCQDNWNDDYANTPIDGTAAMGEDIARRVLRGGSWNNYPDGLRSAYRNYYSPDSRNFSVGFRFICADPLTER